MSNARRLALFTDGGYLVTDQSEPPIPLYGCLFRVSDSERAAVIEFERLQGAEIVPYDAIARAEGRE